MMNESGKDQLFAEQRAEMLERIALHTMLAQETIGRLSLSEKTMRAMEQVPRHEYVPVEMRGYAYCDSPLPIGYDKTISQPFIVALMTDLLDLQPDDRVLEIGTGLGYHSAVLARLCETVYSMELIEELGRSAERRLREQGVPNIALRIGDGSRGWSEHAPYDKIVVAAAPELIPEALLSQLKSGGRMVCPAGIESAQQLMLVTRDGQGHYHTDEMLAVRFSKLEVSH
jgi:protein-L-isoaspartate(D-aspartate) O-methyltransferase